MHSLFTHCNALSNILDYLEVEEILELACMSSTFLEASKHTTLRIRQDLAWLPSVMMSSTTLSKVTPQNINDRQLDPIHNFLYSCPQMTNLPMPYATPATLNLLNTLSPRMLHTLQIHNIWLPQSKMGLIVDVLKNIPTLRSLTLEGVANLVPHPTAYSNLEHLSIRNQNNSYTSPAPGTADPTISSFLSTYNLKSLTSLNVTNSHLSRPPNVTVRKGLPFASSLPGRCFSSSPLSVNAYDGHPLRRISSLNCSLCHSPFMTSITGYLKSPPQQPHITYEVCVDASNCSFSPADLPSTSMVMRDALAGQGMGLDGVPEHVLDLRQEMINCPNDCHKADNKFLVAGGGGWMVDTR
mmetsp:Transcript_23546/g.49011  ORF Transcript_23546/g.49011 Transcript_23546/m.49011 type:complete len:354 (+) Transcript_23546:197-1258(+)